MTKSRAMGIGWALGLVALMHGGLAVSGCGGEGPSARATPDDPALASESSGLAQSGASVGCGPCTGTQTANGCLETLASDVPTPGGLVVRGANVYWVGGGALMQLPSCGGTPSTIATVDGAYALAVGPEHAFIGGEYDVVRVTLDDGKVKKLAGGQSGGPHNIASDATSVYWVTTDTGHIKKAPHGGGEVQTLAHGQIHPLGIAVDDTSVYWADFDGQNVMMVAKDGGTPTTLASGVVGALTIALDATNVYFNDAKYVMSVPKTGGVRTEVGHGDYPGWIAVDGTGVYWTDLTSVYRAVPGGQVVTLAKTGGPDSQGPGEVAVDGKAVYWTVMKGIKGKVMKLTLD